MRKMQAAMEFMVILGAFVFLLAASIHVSMQKTREVEQASDDLEAGRILEMASSKLNTALLEGDGFSANLTLPEKMRGKGYSINISNGVLYISLPGNTYPTRLLTSNITGSLRKGENMISNRNGGLYIS
ncbi:MAG: hypothetical protein HYX24_05485 [Candidatus Aenigmarchaeota archaeon]|nr:hypothetical protein [Candidatus Aenigmarchaeota archaeon]